MQVGGEGADPVVGEAGCGSRGRSGCEIELSDGPYEVEGSADLLVRPCVEAFE